MRVSANGDTCVQSLPTNGSALEVSEATGDESYQVKQQEAVLFKGGHIKAQCPPARVADVPAPAPVQVAHAAPLPPLPAKPPPTSGAALAAALDAASASSDDEAPPAIADTHMTMDAPFVFRADDTPPALTEIVSHLRLDSSQPLALQATVLPPSKHKQKTEAKEQTVAANSSEGKGVFGRIGAFFASIFR